MKKLLLALTATTSLLLAGAASADDAKVDVTTDGESYGYAFGDDLLAAGYNGPAGGVIKLRSRVVRRTLIRPRAHFVPEMLRSVEDL